MVGHHPVTMTTKHDCLFIFMALFATVMFIFTQVVSIFATVPDDPTGWFPNTTEEVSDAYPVQITPAGWTFIIWGIIYIWMIAYLLYILTTICRRNKHGPVYLNPPVVTASFLAVFSLNLAFNVTWLILFSRLEFAWSLADSCLLAFSVYVCLFISYRNVDKHLDIMDINHRFDLWCNRILIQNGLAVYATWTTIATLLNFSITLAYLADVSNSTASIVSLAILTVEIVVYFVADTFYLDRYLRYTVTVYLTVVWALTGALVENWDPSSVASIYTAVLLGAGVVCVVVKVVLLIVRKPHTKKRLQRDEKQATVNEYTVGDKTYVTRSVSLSTRKLYNDVDIE